ncbi:MAG: T9SS type A sorting domain-containing protein, partial [Mariniphaga sp.]
VNEFAQYAVSKRRTIRDNNTYFPAYFLEGFGLFEAGFRPRVDSMKTYMEGRENPEISFIQDTSGIATTLKKDVTVSLIEGQIVGGWSYDEVNPGATGFIAEDWPRYIRGYFLIEEDKRFRCFASTEHFFAYSAPSDSVYARQCIDSLEILLVEYSELYELEINHPWAFTFFHDQENAMEIGGYSSNSNGAGYGGSGLSVYLFTDAGESMLDNWFNYGVLKHEFFHTVSDHFNIFSFFYNEGLTTYMANAPTRVDELNLYNQRIIDVFDYYENTFGRPPTMDEFVYDPHRGVDGFRGIDPYFFGATFFHYIFQTYNYIDVKNFIVGEGDFEGALHKSEKEIESGYLAYLDSLLHPVFQPDTLNIPFFDDFNDDQNTFRNWNRADVLGEEGWHTSIDGSDGSLCTRIYVNESPYEEDDWLFSGLFNTTEAENVKVNFSYYYWGDNFTPEFYYTTSFQGKIEDTEWIKITDLPIIEQWTWKNIELILPNVGDELVFAFRYKTAIGTTNKVMIDNFKIENIATSSKITKLPKNNFKISPNPVTSQSIISFQTKNTGNVTLSVFDLQGRKISTILDKKLPAGSYNYSLNKNIPTDGIYFLRLETQEGISTQKFIYLKE